MSWWALALSFAHAEVPAEVAVSFDAAGEHAAVEVITVESGSGFPNGRIMVFDTAPRALRTDARQRLVNERASGGREGARAAVRADAATALQAAGIDLAAPAAPLTCADGKCGDVAVRVTSTRTPLRADQCAGREGPDLLAVEIAGETWMEERLPALGCPSSWTAEAAYVDGDAIVLLLGYSVPGFEGMERRVTAIAGRI
ncbi:MAG: DUF2259 domain-containing protein [Myxococcota bacterium]